MTGAPPVDRASAGRGRLALAGLALVAAAFAVDLVLDVRHRDLFSWMDPYEYYEFARGVLAGRERFDGFEIPSIFPFFVMPLLAWRPTIPAALGVNLLALPLLLFGLHRLCREAGVRTFSPLVAVLVLCSPLLLGLSRTLYVEFALTAIATAAFVAWLRLLRAPGPRAGVGFGLLLGLGFLTKTTFPVFLAAPVGGAVVAGLAARRDRDALVFAASALVPLVLAALLHASVFAPSLGYYGNLLRTRLPFMYLMGPPEVFSLSSAGYYVAEVGRSFLWLLAPGMLLPLVAVWRGKLRDGPRLALWLWLLGPLVLLAFYPLKEPRHVAPCVVPAVVLLALGIEALPKRALRLGALGAAVAIALAQYAAVTLHLVEAPYFMDRPLRYVEIREAMLRASDPAAYAETPAELRAMHWRYDQNVAVSGFAPNEALALVWQGFPGVVFDLDTFDDPGRFFGREAFARFEDLYFLAAINPYNRRCGWRWYHPTLSRERVVENADFVLVYEGEEGRGEEGEGGPTGLDERFPQHALVATIERPPGRIHVLRSRRATTPYRTLYARRFLEAGGDLPEAERRVVARELLMVAALEGDGPEVRALLHELPELRAPGEVRNVYWIAGYAALERLADRRIAALMAGSRAGLGRRGTPGAAPGAAQDAPRR